MNRHEYWFLDAAVENVVPLDWLRPESVEVALNRPSHGLTPSQIVETLQDLFLKGELRALADDTSEQSEPWVPSREDIEVGLLARVSSMSYELTDHGAQHWEVMSRPNWDLYVVDSYGIDPYEGELVGASEALVAQALEAQRCFGMVVIHGSERWDVLSPWDATYWKRLPAGHQVHFLYEYEKDESSRPPGCEALRKWWTTIRSGWYSNPFSS